ncbi:MAG: hypothetical protein IT352_07510 [Gemmatimonadales bacterium]|nr:hypothetical protein [Gemmatimonadales bacterium]
MTRRDLATWIKGNLTLIVTVGAILAALGYAIQTPGQQIASVRLSVDTVRARVGSVEARLREMAVERRADNDSLFRMLRQLQAAQCVTGNARDLGLIGIPCSTVVSSARQEAAR